MDCPRCKGIMVYDVFEDFQDDTGLLSFDGWRCILCGEIVDPVIAANRGTRPAPLLGHSRKKFATRLG
jgi:hypothetical protein